MSITIRSSIVNDIDAVIIATPDHWHGVMGVESCRAGKDIYMEKPLTFTIKEGVELVRAVRDNNIILATGSQQRSDAAFQHAVELVRNGALGRIEKAHAHVGGPPVPYDLPEEPLPADLNWDLWLGSQPLCTLQSRTESSYIPGSAKQMKPSGAPGDGIRKWAAALPPTGVPICLILFSGPWTRITAVPVRIIPAGYGNYKFLTYEYQDGTIMTEEPFDEAMTKGVKFIGSEGFIEVSRGHYVASDPDFMPPEDTEREDAPAYEIRNPPSGKLH
jgi:hypothetical protein